MAYFLGTSSNDDLNSYTVNYGLEMDMFYGQMGNDRIWAWANDDILDGGLGNDQLYGGSGDDTLEGSMGNDVLSDGSGNDWVNGGTGNDLVHVDLGNDIYVGGDGNDTIAFDQIDDGYFSIENHNPVVFDLSKSSQGLGVLGNDEFFGFENVLGSYGSDRILGSAGANLLDGFEGNDFVDGRTGNDVLVGGRGKDVLIGGKGADTLYANNDLTGDSLQDRLDYNSILDSGTTDLTRDVLWYFDQGGAATDDKIDLRTIDANPFVAGNQAFKFVSTFSNAHVGEVKCIAVTGGDTIIFIDADKDAGAEMTIKVEDVTGLKAFDFIL